MTSLDTFLESVLRLVTTHEVEDAIHQCVEVDLGQLRDHADDYLKLAREKLHVFPFNEVKPCWFRLFTDASIVKAVDSIQSTYARDRDSDTNPSWLDDTVSIIDMAIITAGGLGREETLHHIIDKLQERFNDSIRDRRPAKRRRLFGASDNAELPSQVVSVPNLDYPVSRHTCPALEEFQHWMNNKRQPLLLEGTLEHWPALTSWKQLSYWLDLTFGGRRLVPIETGRSYVDDGWGQKIRPFSEFLDHYILAADKSPEPGYLAQHDLFRQIPALHAAVSAPDYCYLDAPSPQEGTPLALKKQLVSRPASHPTLLPQPPARNGEGDDAGADVHRNIWFGPAWTISPLHYDPYHNILCQIVGKKYIRLYSPLVSQQLKAMSATEPAPHLCETGAADEASIDMSNTSAIDIAAMEMSPTEDWDEVYPGISEVPYFECILSAGQALYIPIGWWHYVRSCSVGISVSYWW